MSSGDSFESRPFGKQDLGYNTSQPYIAEPHALRRTYSDINIVDDEVLGDVAANRVSHFMWKDWKSNFTIVTVPAIFTNALWRGMNIGGVAVRDSPAMVILETAAYIGTLVWVLCSLIDTIRQLIVLNGFSNFMRCKWGAKGYSFRASVNLGWKFFMGVVGWTAGYEIVAGTHMFYAGTSTALEYVAHGVGAALGEFCGLLIACEVTHITEFIFTMQHSTAPPTGSFGVATKGILEGFVWSVIGDANIYQAWGSNVGSALADSFLLGLGAAIGFSVMGLFTSVLGFWFIHRRLRNLHH